MASCRERHFEQSRKATAKKKIIIIIKKWRSHAKEYANKVGMRGTLGTRLIGALKEFEKKNIVVRVQHAKVQVQQPGACLVRSPSPKVSLSACSITTCPPPLPALSLSPSSTGWITSAVCARCHTTNTRWAANKPSGTSLLSMMIHAAVYLTFDLQPLLHGLVPRQSGNETVQLFLCTRFIAALSKWSKLRLC